MMCIERGVCFNLVFTFF